LPFPAIAHLTTQFTRVILFPTGQPIVAIRILKTYWNLPWSQLEKYWNFSVFFSFFLLKTEKRQLQNFNFAWYFSMNSKDVFDWYCTNFVAISFYFRNPCYWRIWNEIQLQNFYDIPCLTETKTASGRSRRFWILKKSDQTNWKYKSFLKFQTNGNCMAYVLWLFKSYLPKKSMKFLTEWKIKNPPLPSRYA